MAQHHGKQPDDPGGSRLIGEDNMELSEIHLSLFAGSRFEPNFKPVFGGRADVSEKVRDSSVATGISAFLELSQEPSSAKTGIGRHSFTQIRRERVNDRRPRLPWSIGRCLNWKQLISCFPKS